MSYFKRNILPFLGLGMVVGSFPNISWPSLLLACFGGFFILSTILDLIDQSKEQ